MMMGNWCYGIGMCWLVHTFKSIHTHAYAHIYTHIHTHAHTYAQSTHTHQKHIPKHTHAHTPNKHTHLPSPFLQAALAGILRAVLALGMFTSIFTIERGEPGSQSYAVYTVVGKVCFVWCEVCFLCV